MFTSDTLPDIPTTCRLVEISAWSSVHGGHVYCNNANNVGEYNETVLQINLDKIKQQRNNYHNKSFGTNDGLILMVFHELTGETLLTRVFQTYHYYAYGFDLKFWLEKLQPGRIVVLSVKRMGLPSLFWVKSQMKAMGSVFIDTAPFWSMWIWATVVKGKTILEALHLNQKTLETHNFLTFPSFTSHVGNEITDGLSHQEQLCSKIAAMGSYCDVQEYMRLKRRIKLSSNLKTRKIKIGIILFAGVRLQYFMNAIISMFSSPEIDKLEVLVTVGNSFTTRKPNKDIIAILNDLNLQYSVIPNYDQSTNVTEPFTESFHYYRTSMSVATKSFREFDFIAFLDEDVTVSSDWMNLLEYAAPLLLSDPTLWCVTPVNGVRRKGGNPEMLLRGNRSPGYGFLMTRKSVEEALNAMEIGHNSLYDLWLSNFMRERECIFPEIARVNHFGIGINTLPDHHQFYSIEVDLHDGKPSNFTPIEQLSIANYSRKLIHDLQHAKPYLKNPCERDFLSAKNTSERQVYVFPYSLPLTSDMFEWHQLALCIGLYPHSVSLMHKFTVPLSLSDGSKLWLIGVPRSEYSSYVSEKIVVWQFGDERTLENDVSQAPNFTNHTIQNIIKENFKLI